jgi:uncharacterized protein YjdB
VATVSRSGDVSAVAPGYAVITATCLGMSGTSIITVASDTVASVEVSPASASLSVGGTQQLVATAKDAAGNTLGGRIVTWSSDNSAATVSASGLVTGAATGTAHVTATCEGKTGSSTITVTIAPVASVSVSPASASVAVGATTPLTATPKDASGNALTGRTITWASDNTAAATVNASGVVSGLAAGTAHVTATCEGQSGSSTITVTLVPVASVSVTPASAGINVGATQQLSATAKDASGNTLTGRTITWASDNTAAATVSSSGLVRGIAAGTAHVTATCESQSGSSTITVTLVPVASVSVTPASFSLQTGATQQLTATPKDASGNALTGRTITWASDNTAAATVSSSGLVRGIAAGTAHVTATCESQSAASSCTVSAPSTGGGGSFSNCPIFPADNIWNRDISALPVHPMSATWVATLSGNSHLWPSFYPNTYGMKYVVTNGSTPKVPISITGQDPSDSDVPGPYPFTASTPIEVGTPDAHAFMIDTTTCTLYEMYLADWNNGSPQAHAAVIWNLNSNALRADNHSSADEAGLAIFSGLTRWDEVQAGAIRHALRFEATEGHINGTQGAHLWPARHDSSTPNSNAPPMGARFRLKASYDISGFSPHTQVVLQALKHYGMLLSDVGLDWELVGTADPNWDTNTIQELFTVPASAFEAVDESGLMIDPNSAQSR